MVDRDLRFLERRGLRYVVADGGGVRRSKPWLGDCLSFLYDFIMRRFIFPGKFEGDIARHEEILREVLHDVHGKRVLELATGSGSASSFLAHDNRYVGTDISPGLLHRAVKRFRAAGFVDPEFYVTGAEELPFDEGRFDLCLCILSQNFFDDLRAVYREVRRVLVPGGVFVCSIPVPERKTTKRS